MSKRTRSLTGAEAKRRRARIRRRLAGAEARWMRKMARIFANCPPGPGLRFGDLHVWPRDAVEELEIRAACARMGITETPWTPGELAQWKP